MQTDTFKELAHDLALQIAASAPISISPVDLPAREWDAHLLLHAPTLEGLAHAERERHITEMRSRFEREHCLLSQGFIKDERITVATLIHQVSERLRDSIYVVRFVRYDGTEI
jgi:elongation factor Ts